MPTSPYLIALINPVLWSLIVMIYRIIMPRGADARTLMIYSQIGAVLVIGLIAGIPSFSAVTGSLLWLLVLSGFAWGLGVYLEIRALEHLEAAAVGVIGALRYVLTLLAGVFIFGEAISLTRGLGAVLIVAAILGISNVKNAAFGRGFTLQLLAVFPQLAAYAIDKYLAAQLPINLVAMSAYFFPGIVTLALFPRLLLAVPAQIAQFSGLTLLIPLFQAGTYLAALKAFSLAEFIPMMAIFESSVVLIWILGFLFLHERDRPLRSLLSCVGCLVGVILVCWK